MLRTLSIFQTILFLMWDVTGAYSHQHQCVSKAQVPEEGSLLWHWEVHILFM